MTLLVLARLTLLTALVPAAVAAQAAPARWTLEETLRLDRLGGVWKVELDREGNLYVARAGMPWVDVLDPGGRPLRKIGDGFVFGATDLGWKGDTLWVAVPGMPGAVRLYAADGRALGAVRFDRRLASEGTAFTPSRLLADGTVYPEAKPERRPEEYWTWERLPLHRFSRDGEVVDTIAMIPVHPLPNLFWSRNGSATCCWQRNWFWTWRTYTGLPVVPTADGSAVLFVEERRAPGASGTFDLFKVGIAGDTILKRAISYPRRVLTEADRAWIRDWHGRFASGELYGDGLVAPSSAAGEANRRAAVAALTYPEAFPPVRWIVAGADGTIWLLREYRPDGADLWEVYDGEGRLEGSLLIAEGAVSAPWEFHQEPLRATRDELWTRGRPDGYVPGPAKIGDQDWVIRRYRIVRQ